VGGVNISTHVGDKEKEKVRAYSEARTLVQFVARSGRRHHRHLQKLGEGEG
jgi:hypothetical protein